MLYSREEIEDVQDEDENETLDDSVENFCFSFTLLIEFFSCSHKFVFFSLGRSSDGKCKQVTLYGQFKNLVENLNKTI